MNGKGDKPRNCYSKQFKANYDQIKWRSYEVKDQRQSSVSACSEGFENSSRDCDRGISHRKDKHIRH